MPRVPYRFFSFLGKWRRRSTRNWRRSFLVTFLTEITGELYIFVWRKLQSFFELNGNRLGPTCFFFFFCASAIWRRLWRLQGNRHLYGASSTVFFSLSLFKTFLFIVRNIPGGHWAVKSKGLTCAFQTMEHAQCWKFIRFRFSGKIEGSKGIRSVIGSASWSARNVTRINSVICIWLSAK